MRPSDSATAVSILCFICSSLNFGALGVMWALLGLLWMCKALYRTWEES